MRTNKHLFIAKLASSLSLVVPLLAGCGPQSVTPSVALVDRTTKPLSLGSFLEVNGVYGNDCVDRSGGWSVSIGSFSTPTNPALSVVRHDTGCQLLASSIRLGSLSGSTLYATAVPVTLGSDYASRASAFAASASAPTAFYANLRIKPDLSFANDFSIDMLYSEDPNWASAGAVASFGVQSAIAAAGPVPAPDYAIDMTGVAIQVDANRVVQSIGGSAVLSTMNISGQTFVVSTRDLGGAPSYSEVDAEYQAAPATSLVGSNPVLAADSFLLSGANLSQAQVRTLIIANTESGTASYEVFRVTFSGP